MANTLYKPTVREEEDPNTFQWNGAVSSDSY